jgi:hypothetical protein
MGTGLVLLNTGIDELGNPRLRDASSVSRLLGRHLRPADPTPVLSQLTQQRGRVAGFLHSFSRASVVHGSGTHLASQRGQWPPTTTNGKRP